METTNNPTTNENLPVKQMRETLPDMLNKFLPELKRRKANADKVLDELVSVEDDEDEEYALKVLGAVKKVYDVNQSERKQMTDITDAFKDELMQYERDFDYKAGAKSKYNQKKKLVEDYQQTKLEKRRQQELLAAKQKEVENLKVDIRAKILENLTNKVAEIKLRTENGSRKFFEETTLEQFEERAKYFKGMTIKMKKEDFEACFALDDTFSKKLVALNFPAGEFSALTAELQQTETFDKWNAQVVEEVSPIINDWRARIPEIKKQKEDLAAAASKSEEERKRVEQEQKDKDAERQREREEEIKRQNEIKQNEIQQEAMVDKTGNELQHQAATQGMEDGGRAKLVMKFTEPKHIPKGLSAIIYHCMGHKDFPGVQKRNKDKTLMVDDKGRPVYIDIVQGWIDLYMKLGVNASIEGTFVSEDAKITVRK